MSDVSKLPPMPTDAQILKFGAQWGDNRRIVYYRARMEALLHFIDDNRHGIRLPLTHDERRAMDALLAACERGTS